ncbi:MAG: AAA family ATPase [Phycisphaerae bacterium SM23_33]|nr:MAG: AAA family ATPase [Phycisphaerae bacterium SM23_33]
MIKPTEAFEETIDEKRAAEMIEQLKTGRQKILGQIRRVIIGQDEVVEQVLLSFFAGGHCLITGVPGLAKTLLIKSIGDTLDLSFRRIQFTPDLMPSDITGTEILEEDRATGKRDLKFLRGPVFANIILADEINRTPPKTQAALLEAMQEHQVTVGGKTYKLNEPFFVLATQNPIEHEGTYPLPTIQQDRFMFSVIIDYLPKEQEIEVVNSTTSKRPELLACVMHGQDLLTYQRIVRAIPVADAVARYAVRLVACSRPQREDAPDFVKEFVSWGASLRASHYLVLAGKARAVLDGRFGVSVDDVEAVAMPVLRHRIITNFRAEAARVRSEQIVGRLLKEVPKPSSGL